MNPHHAIGIDIGTHSIKVLVTEYVAGAEPRILHAIESPSHGFRHGYIVDQEKALESLLYAVRKTEREYKQKITQARFAIGGIGLESHYIRTSIQNQRKNNDIEESSLRELLEKAEDLFIEKYPNKKILHIIPVKYRVDDQDVLGAPLGMYGSMIEVKVIFITLLEHHYDSFINLIRKSGLEIYDLQAIPLADSNMGLSYKQKTQGCVLVNIGAETTNVSIFENGILTSLEVFSLGSNDITNDLALGLKIPLKQAEIIKISGKHEFPKKTVDEIIHARTSDILELVSNHLMKLKKHRMLPAGIVVTGGGSHIDHLMDYAKAELHLPAESVELSILSQKTKRNMRIPNSFGTAYGMCFNREEVRTQNKTSFSFKKVKNHLEKFLKELMP